MTSPNNRAWPIAWLAIGVMLAIPFLLHACEVLR